MKSKLIILGCGNSTGVPTIDGKWGMCNKKNKKNLRTRSSAIILKGSNSILIDTSPDIRSQLLKHKIKKISSVIYTHEHSDQTNGLFELRPFYWIDKKKINIYGTFNLINASYKNDVRQIIFTSTFSLYEKDLIYITIAGRSNALSGFVAANSDFPTLACPPFSDKSDQAHTSKFCFSVVNSF